MRNEPGASSSSLGMRWQEPEPALSPEWGELRRAERLDVKKKEEGTQNRALRDPSSEATRFRHRHSAVLEIECEQGKCRAWDSRLLEAGEEDLVVQDLVSGRAQQCLISLDK